MRFWPRLSLDESEECEIARNSISCIKMLHIESIYALLPSGGATRHFYFLWWDLRSLPILSGERKPPHRFVETLCFTWLVLKYPRSATWFCVQNLPRPARASSSNRPSVNCSNFQVHPPLLSMSHEKYPLSHPTTLVVGVPIGREDVVTTTRAHGL